MIKEFTAQKIPVNHSVFMSRTAAEDRATLAHLIDQSRLELRTYIHALGEERILIHEKWPADWWQAVKERWFPRWALRRWPVKHREIKIDEPRFAAVCPHIQDDPKADHLRWMAMNST